MSIQINCVTKRYMTENIEVCALNDISMSMGDCGLISVIGESGSGKTTLLNLLAGLDNPTEGTILVNHESIQQFDEESQEEYHRNTIGIVHQDFWLFEQLTVKDNLEKALNILYPVDKVSVMIDEVLEKFQILELKDKKICNLSGGQKQRVAIARAYARGSRILLADEPTGNLDSENSEMIYGLLQSLSKEILVIVVTHNKMLAEDYSDRIIELKDGRIQNDRLLSREKEGDEKGTAFTDEKKVYKRCTFWELNRLRKELLVIRKGKLIATIICLAIFTLLLLVTVNCITYNETRPIVNGMEKYKENSGTVFENCNVDSNTYSGEEDIYIGKSLVKALYKCVGEEAVCRVSRDSFTSDSDMLTWEERYETSQIETFSADVAVKQCGVKQETQQGMVELNEYEMLVTDYVAKECGLTQENIGDSYYLGSSEMILKGIVDTDFEEKKTPLMNPREEEYIDYRDYNFVYISEATRMSMLKETGKLYAPWNPMDRSLYSYSRITQKFSKKPEELDYQGVWPVDNNEIAVDILLVTEWGYTEEEIIGKEFPVLDLYSSERKGLYNESFNLYDYVGESIKVTAVVHSEYSNCYLSDTCYEKAFSDYCAFYAFDYVEINMGTRLEESIKAIHNANIRVGCPTYNLVYSVVDVKAKVIPYMIAALLLVLILGVSLIVGFIGYSGLDNARNIAILRTFGYRGRDISGLFLIQSMMIIGQAAMLGVVGYSTLIFIINRKVAVYEKMRAFTLVYPTIYVVLAVFMIFVLGAVVTYYPVKKLKKYSIIEAKKAGVL